MNRHCSHRAILHQLPGLPEPSYYLERGGEFRAGGTAPEGGNAMSAVLVIDDEKQVLDLLETALTLHGYKVEIAADGREGITKFDRHPYDIVITDVRMPGLDGVGVVHHIRESVNSTTPVMAISGTPWHFEDGDFDAVLEKPFSIRALVEHLEKLEGRREILPPK